MLDLSKSWSYTGEIVVPSEDGLQVAVSIDDTINLEAKHTLLMPDKWQAASDEEKAKIEEVAKILGYSSGNAMIMACHIPAHFGILLVQAIAHMVKACNESGTDELLQLAKVIAPFDQRGPDQCVITDMIDASNVLMAATAVSIAGRPAYYRPGQSPEDLACTKGTVH